MAAVPVLRKSEHGPRCDDYQRTDLSSDLPPTVRQLATRRASIFNTHRCSITNVADHLSKNEDLIRGFFR